MKIKIILVSVMASILGVFAGPQFLYPGFPAISTNDVTQMIQDHDEAPGSHADRPTVSDVEALIEDDVSVLQSSLDSLRLNDALGWTNHQYVAIMPQGNDANYLMTQSRSALNNTVSLPLMHLYLGTNGFVQVPALSPTTLANTKVLYLDITNPSSPSYGTVSAGSYDFKSNRGNRIPVMVNWYGLLYGYSPSIQNIIDKSVRSYAANVTTNHVKVASVGGDYATITLALAAITDASSTKRYTISVAPGTYSEVGSGGVGLVLKDYVDIVGPGPDFVTIRGPEQAAGSEHLGSTIFVPANCVVSGITIEAFRTKYCVHADNAGVGLSSRVFTLANCRLKHYGGNDGYDYDIGMGLWNNQTINIQGVECLGRGVFVHGQNSSRVSGTSWTLNLSGVTANEVHVKDFLEYSFNRVYLTGCRVGRVLFTADPSSYVANPANGLYNRGYHNRSVAFVIEGSEIRRVDYADTTSTNLVPTPLVFAGMNRSVVASNAVSYGYAAKYLPDVGIQNFYPNATSAFSRVTLWDGSGLFAGVAERDCSAGAIGVVQYAGDPYVYADASELAIEYGDALEVSSSGSWVKASTGVVRAYALQALPSGAGLIVARLSK